jgi:hydroxyethylthiazole kinase
MSEGDLARRFGDALARIRAEKPLIHHITSPVVMSETANMTLLMGALPVMARAREEVADMVSAADCLVLNLGTPDPEVVEAMLVAGKWANERGIPVVLDPVGAGATPYRKGVGLRLLHELKVAIIRGNAGEIGVLSGVGGTMKGVESVGGPRDPAAAASEAARRWGTVVAMTGRRDIVADGRRTLAVDNGHPWLAKVVGTGCMATSVAAAFAAVEGDPLLAAAAGLAGFGLAAELAVAGARGPASFKVALFDAVYELTPEQLEAGARVTWLT